MKELPRDYEISLVGYILAICITLIIGMLGGFVFGLSVVKVCK